MYAEYNFLFILNNYEGNLLFVVGCK